MTNWEFMKLAIDGKVDDGGASREAEIYYHIDCPYYCGDPRAGCHEDKPITRDLCAECKSAWLEKEYQ